jgi:hypothetical protein
VSSGLTAIDVQDLAGDEAGSVEVEDRVGDVTDLADPADGVEAGHAVVGRAVVLGGFATPGATALTRMPRDAYSIASERVTAASPPLVRAVRAAGDPLLAWSARLVVMLTTWPAPWMSICRIARWVM